MLQAFGYVFKNEIPRIFRFNNKFNENLDIKFHENKYHPKSNKINNNIFNIYKNHKLNNFHQFDHSLFANNINSFECITYDILDKN